MSWHDSAECGLCLCRRLNRKGNFRKVDVTNDLFITSTTLYNFNFAPLLHQHSSCLVGSMNCGKRGNLLTWSSTTTTKPCWNQAARRRGYLDHPDGHCGIRSSLPLYVEIYEWYAHDDWLFCSTVRREHHQAAHLNTAPSADPTRVRYRTTMYYIFRERLSTV